MTAPKIGGRGMTIHVTHIPGGSSEMFELTLEPFEICVLQTFGGYIALLSLAGEAPILTGKTSQLAADAASSYLRTVALEILEAVDPEAAKRVLSGPCRECKHHDGRYCCRRDEDCVLAEVTDEDGFCHRFERKT